MRQGAPDIAGLGLARTPQCRRTRMVVGAPRASRRVHATHRGGAVHRMGPRYGVMTTHRWTRKTATATATAQLQHPPLPITPRAASADSGRLATCTHEPGEQITPVCAAFAGFDDLDKAVRIGRNRSAAVRNPGCSQARRSVLSSVYGPDNGTRPSSVTITAAAVPGAPAGAIRSAQPNQNHQSPRPLPAAVMTSAHIRLSWGFCTNRRASRPRGGGDVRGPPAGCQFRRQRVQPRQPRPARRAATVGARHHLTSLPAYASGQCRRRTPRRHRSQLWGRPLEPH